MRLRIVIVVALYLLAAAFTVAAYRLYLPQYTLISDRGWGTTQRGSGGAVTVVQLFREHALEPALDADTVMLLDREGMRKR
jgi:hypothetical protein